MISAVLTLGLPTALPALTGCAKKPAQMPKPLPDVAVLNDAIAAERDLIALHEAVTGAHPELAGRLSTLLAHHRDHLLVLRRHYRPGTGERTPAAPPPPATVRGTTGATASAAPPAIVASPSVPAGLDQALAVVRAAERQAAAARIRDVGQVPPGLAQLFASIGACEAGHVAMLGGAP